MASVNHWSSGETLLLASAAMPKFCILSAASVAGCRPVRSSSDVLACASLSASDRRVQSSVGDQSFSPLSYSPFSLFMETVIRRWDEACCFCGGGTPIQANAAAPAGNSKDTDKIVMGTKDGAILAKLSPQFESLLVRSQG